VQLLVDNRSIKYDFISKSNLLDCDVLSGERGTAVAQWLRHCTTNRKVAVSIPDVVNTIFY
jgi:hypothetical protein